MRGLSLVAVSGGHSSSRCAGLSPSWPLLLRSTGSRRAGSVVVAHGLSCPAACGIFPDQGSNPCPLHWQADSQPLRHQGNPDLSLYVQDSLTCMCRPDIPFHVLGGKRGQTERRNHLITHAFPNHLQWSKPLRTSQGAHVLA